MIFSIFLAATVASQAQNVASGAMTPRVSSSAPVAGDAGRAAAERRLAQLKAERVRLTEGIDEVWSKPLPAKLQRALDANAAAIAQTEATLRTMP